MKWLWSAVWCIWFGISGSLVSAVTVHNDQLIVSNYPETLVSPGSICDEIMTTRSIRIVYHHKSKSRADLHILVQIRNLSEYPVVVDLQKGLSGPSKDEVFTGYKSVNLFMQTMQNKKSEQVKLAPFQQKVVVLHRIKRGMVVSGMLRLGALGKEQPVQVSLVASDISNPHLSALCQLPDEDFSIVRVPQSIIVKRFNYQCEDHLIELPIGAPPYFTDQRSGIELRGNYGIFYRFYVTLVNPYSEARRIRVLLSPVAGVARAVVLVNNHFVQTGLLKPSVERALDYIYDETLAANSVKELDILTTPIPGSYYPINLIFQNIKAKP